MTRDPQAALVALNRFGFGARGGAAGDFVNAASDPRGFVKAELSRPNGMLLEVPGLLSTPALGGAGVSHPAEGKQARSAAARAGAQGRAVPRWRRRNRQRMPRRNGAIFRSTAAPWTSRRTRRQRTRR